MPRLATMPRLIDSYGHSEGDNMKKVWRPGKFWSAVIGSVVGASIALSVPAPKQDAPNFIDGKVVIEKYRDGELYAKAEGHNMIVNTGAGHILKLITGEISNVLSYDYAQIGVGNSTTAPAQTQTTLVGNTTSWKGMGANYPTAVVANCATFSAIWNTSEGNQVWGELGLRESQGSTLLSRLTNGASTYGTKTSSESWTVNYTICVKSGS